MRNSRKNLKNKLFSQPAEPHLEWLKLFLAILMGVEHEQWEKTLDIQDTYFTQESTTTHERQRQAERPQLK